MQMIAMEIHFKEEMQMNASTTSKMKSICHQQLHDEISKKRKDNKTQNEINIETNNEISKKYEDNETLNEINKELEEDISNECKDNESHNEINKEWKGEIGKERKDNESKKCNQSRFERRHHQPVTR
jgi:hypothetical protein